MAAAKGMVEGLTFHHIGYAVESIDETAAFYLANGYEKSPTVLDDVQQTNICFLSKQGEPTIELVEPATEKCSVNKILKKNGVHPYHCCYEADNVERAFDALCEAGFTPLFRPVEAIAFQNRLICYFFKREVGFIEIVEKPC